MTENNFELGAYTYLHLNRDNGFGIKTSLYNSTDILAGGAKGEQIKPSLLYKRKKSEEDRRAVEDANPWFL